MIKVLVITSCTKDKIIPPGFDKRSQLISAQLWDERGDDRALRDFGELEKYRIPAVQLYKGQQHVQMLQGVGLLRQAFGHDVVDIKIISAGFGVVDELQLIPPYEVSFAELSSSKILVISQKLRIPQKICTLMLENYDYGFFLLGDSYLMSIGLPFSLQPTFPCFFLASPSSQKRIPSYFPYYFVPIGKNEAIDFGYNLVGLKGYLFKLFAQQMVASISQISSEMPDRNTSRSEYVRRFLTDLTPQQFLSLVSPFRKSGKTSTIRTQSQEMIQLPLFTIVNTVSSRARNYGRPMRYFIPDWDDLVDPGYNFEADMPTPEKMKHDDEVYSHQIYKEANYDGLLFSKSTVESSQAKKMRVKETSIHTFARFSKSIIGDCGAFSYINSEKPPYQTREILDYYQDFGFDYGVSIDHLIVPAFYPVKEYRYELTRKNAYEFISLHHAGNYTFTPIGAVQGWSPETYRDAVIELLEWGYKYVGLGGIARAKTEEIYKILEAIAPVLQRDTDLHLFGVARDRENNEMQRFRELGVTSFDSASYLRRAWMSANTNYFTEDGRRYGALRISPVYPSSPRVRALLSEGIATFEQLQKLEKDALKAVREYDRGKLDLETALTILLQIDALEKNNYDEHKVLYRKTLEDQPWKQCSCEICTDLGIEVIIFRGNDRNRRRGFHNTYVFYKRFRKLIEVN